MKSLRADLKAFIKLGEILKSLTNTTLSTWYPMISNNNAIFVPCSSEMQCISDIAVAVDCFLCCLKTAGFDITTQCQIAHLR